MIEIDRDLERDDHEVTTPTSHHVLFRADHDVCTGRME